MMKLLLQPRRRPGGFMPALLWIIVAYVVGSMPFGLLLARLFSGFDPRTAGSGNVGATNVARTCGKGVGVLTLLCDLCKGLIIVALARWAGLSVWVASLVALAAVCGHVFSLFLRFRGGKGVATTVGVMLALAFWQAAVAGIVCLIVAWRTGFVSFGSLCMMAVLVVLLLVSLNFSLLPLALVLAMLILWTHRENVKRLAAGTEKHW